MYSGRNREGLWEGQKEQNENIRHSVKMLSFSPLEWTLLFCFLSIVHLQEWEAQPHAHLNANYKSINIC